MKILQWEILDKSIETDAKNITGPEISLYLKNAQFLPNPYETWWK